VSDPTRLHPDHSFPTADPSSPAGTNSVGEATNAPNSSSAHPKSTKLPSAPPGYELLEEIGRGGMGVVYRGRDLTLSRDVAVKLLQDRYALTSLAGRRFVDEAKITGQLQHPGIPPVHEVGELPDGRPFLVMKLIKGRTLAKLILEGSENRGSLVAAFEQVCQAVAYAHNHGVVHRDLKPANVMVGAFGEVQVMDWGLAKFRAETRADSAEASIASTFHDPRTEADEDLHTRAGSFLGTPAYMSPEQAIGAVDQVDERSDVFGLGAVLCAILTGEPPFVADTTESTRQLAAQKKVESAFARLDACGAEPGLVALCKRCLAGDQEARLRNAGEVASAIHAIRVDVEQRARQAELETVRVEGERQKAELRAVEQHKRRRVQLLLAVLVVFMLFAVGAFGWWQDRQMTERRIETGNRERDERERQDRNAEAVAILLDRGDEALRADNPAKATVALEAAEKRSGEGGADHLTHRIEQARTDLAVLRDLDAVDQFRWTWAENSFPSQKVVAERYREVLGKMGADPDQVGPEVAASRVAASAIRDRMVSALDMMLIHETSKQVRTALRIVDPDPFRDEVRDSAFIRNAARFLLLVNKPEALDQPPGFVTIMINYRDLHVLRQRELLAAAIHKRPGNISLLMSLGNTYQIYKPDTVDRLWLYEAAVAAAPTNAAAHNNLGVALYDRKDLTGAEAEFRETLRLDPKHAIAYGNLGNVLSARNDLAGAEAAYRESVRLQPAAHTHNNLGSKLQQKGDLAGAEAAFREAIRCDPSYALAYHNLASVLNDRSDPVGAETAYRDAIRVNSKSSAAHYKLGAILLARNELSDAEPAFREAIRLDPKHVAAHHDLGSVRYRQGDLAGAEAEYREALRLDSSHALAHYNLGWTLDRKGDLWGAELEFRETIRLDPKRAGVHTDLTSVIDRQELALRNAIRLDPKSAAHHHDLGSLLARREDLVNAEAEYREAIRLDPKIARIHHNLGRLLNQKGEVAGAEAELREAIRLDPNDSGFHYTLGNLLQLKKDTNAAVAEFWEAVRIDPKFMAALNNLASLLEYQGDRTNAETLLREAIRLDPKAGVPHFNLGNLLLRAGDPVGAEAEYRDACQLEPKLARARSTLGMVLMEKGDLAGAEAAFREAIRLDPKYSPDQINLGNVLKDKGDLAGAVAAYREAIRLDPNDHRSHYNLGQLLSVKDDSAGAEAEYRHTIRINPNIAIVHSSLAVLLERNNDLKGAEAELREAIRLEPNVPQTQSNLTKVLERAEAAYREAIRLDPKNARTHNDLGGLLERKGERAAAEAAFREAIHLDPNYLDAYNNLASMLLNNKSDLVDLEIVFREIIRLDPKNASALSLLGNNLRARFDLTGAWESLLEAESLLREAIRLDPRLTLAHNNLGNVLLRKGELGGAVASFREAIRLYPTFAAAHNNLGNVLLLKGDLIGAEAPLREAIRLDPKLARPHNHLGTVLARKGDLDGAIVEYREALRLDPKDPYAVVNLPQTERMRTLLPRLPDVLSGKAVPASAVEACEFARLCGQSFVKQYAAAVRLYETAFHTDKTLAADLSSGHCSMSAFCAAKAARGDGVDAPKVDQVRDNLRGKALAWLESELALQKRQAGSSSAKARQAAVDKLKTWQVEWIDSGLWPALAQVMSTDERANWDAFWTEVRKTIATAQKRPREVAPLPRLVSR
jgi:Flp pilus assembly protein TadD/serine/threonine protein kinase